MTAVQTCQSDARAPHSRQELEAIHVSPQLIDAAHANTDAVLLRLESSSTGLTSLQAERRLEQSGPNELVHHPRADWTRRLFKTVRNPLVILLAILAIISFATGDPHAGAIMLLIVGVSLTLRFVQETRADSAAARLKAMIHITATVMRDGEPQEIPVRNLVPGDVIHLAAGDMIPADVRLLASKDLFINQASLTGESMPVEKSYAVEPAGKEPLELSNITFAGTSVESGTGSAVVITTGQRTYLGALARLMTGKIPKSAFDKGVDHFTWMMIRFTAVMVPLVFLINGLTKHDWKEAFFFAIAVAVGMTPEMLPMIIAVCLSKGALAMSRRKVIVKRLDAIQNFGAMDILCTDKTGTLTQDRVILERHCNVAGEESSDVLLLGFLISHFQTGLKNLLDRAILDCEETRAFDTIAAYRKLDELPFDFARRMMSVVVETPDAKTVLLTKGAPEEVLARCVSFELDGEVSPINDLLINDVREEYESLSNDGFRVLAIASRELPRQDAYTRDAECDLILKGYIAFLDPPKSSAGPAIVALEKHGITIKVLTGDNPLVSRKVCSEVGLADVKSLLGRDIENMSDADLADAAEKTTLFSRLSPVHKQRIIRALQSRGHVVGFMGDGINDAPALRAADVAISVDTAVDIAKESASVILLEKSLMVLDEGVLEGRKVFANILKYIRMGASSNFGNMLSVVGASAFLPFLPMTPIQVLTNNLLYDFSQTPIPTDAVDEEQLAKPRPWHIDQIKRFILCIGPISSIFDYTTFAIMLWVFNCWDPRRAPLFQTGWFIESLMTQTLIIHVIRTRKFPFIQSRASLPLTITTLLIAAIALALPYSPLAAWLGFTPPPPLYWPLLALTLLCYLGLTQATKAWLLQRSISS